MPQYDLLVIGAGMAGLTAAARATAEGRRVLVVEVSGDAGGSARFAGYAWTAPSREVMDQVNPGGDAALKHALVDRFADGVEWIRSVGVDVDDAVPILGFGRGHRFDTNQYVDACRRVVTDGGGEVRLRTATRRLLTDDGRVSGAEIEGPDGAVEHVAAAWTLLATGGFQADRELIAEKVHIQAPRMQLRSNPHSSGTGYRLATAVGAATGPEDAGFYGHLVPTHVPFADSGDFVGLSLYYSEHALLFNLRNERFTDETLGDHLTTMALLEQPEARGLLVADARVHRDWIVGAYVEGAVAVDKFAMASRRGGRVGLAEELEELEYLPEEWGYDGAAIRAAVERYNADATAGDVEPGRTKDRAPLDEGPWYVVECEPAITFPFHGVRIDDRAQVLHTSGTPVPGLLAAGSDTGGLWYRAYAGGLASALVFGLTAATTAAAPAPTPA